MPGGNQKPKHKPPLHYTTTQLKKRLPSLVRIRTEGGTALTCASHETRWCIQHTACNARSKYTRQIIAFFDYKASCNAERCVRNCDVCY